MEATARAPLPWSTWLVNRARVDLRGLDAEFSQRFRDRLRLERALSVADHTVVPYAGAEVFYDTRFGARSREQYQAGAEILLSDNWRFELYVRQDENHRPSRTHDHVLGLVLKYYQ